jgi:bacillithiol biosynthesis cysteine-adding enzyme BshC
MDRRKLSFKEIKGTSRLFEDFLFDFEKAAPYYCADFRNLDKFRNNAERLAEHNYARDQLAEILSDQNNQYGLGEKSRKNIEKLRDKKTCVVFTGQQVGLLTGPIYTIYKTLTAIKLAEYLQSQIGVNVIPIFWLATDDHDFEEVRHVHVLDKNSKPTKIYYQPETMPGDVPMGFVKCNGKISEFLDEVINTLPQTQYTSELESLIRETYSPGIPIADAFGKMLGKLFADSGIVLVNPADPRIKQLAVPIFTKEIAEFESSNQIVSLANSELAGLGYHLQVHNMEDYLNLFYYTGKRARIGHNDQGYFIDGVDKIYSQDELTDTAKQVPVYFSPNVLLRPVTQDYIFPTLAYIGGPAEVAYFAQIKDLHNHFGVQCPIVFPRISATVLDKYSDSNMRKYDLKWKDISDNKALQSKIKEIVAGQVPEEIIEKMEEDRDSITSKILDFEKYLEDFDEGVKKTVQKTKGKVEYELKSLQEKIIKAYKRKNDDLVRSIERTADFLFPEESLQERHLNILTFLNMYGFEFIDVISKNLKLDAYDHQVLCLTEMGC